MTDYKLENFATAKPAEPLTASSWKATASTQAEAAKNMAGGAEVKTEAINGSSELDQEQPVVSERTTELQPGTFIHSGLSTAAHCPLDAAVNQICDGLEQIKRHAVEEIEHEFEPFLWPIIESLTQVAYDAVGNELDDAVMEVFFKFGPRLIWWICVDIEAYLERVNSSSMKLDPSMVSPSSGEYHG